MKKLLALLLSVGTLSTVFAQSHDRSWNDRDQQYNKRGDYHSRNYSNDLKQRDAQIKMINRDYERQIQDIRRNRRIRGSEKYNLISRLERQRDYQVSQVIDRYAKNFNGRYDDRWANNNRRN